ncbi:MAG: methylaspartate ammonia-lyase [Anaerolineae bacterium]|nr:methylaspartate ammonia-lyase [Anaerolineae bacterium]
MARIVDILTAPATGGYYVEDLAALQASPLPVERRYTADPVTPGFRHAREVAEAVCVGLVLDDGRVAWGDCVAVAYGGKAGRDGVFRAEEGVAALRGAVAPALEGRTLARFRELAAEVDVLIERVEIERPLPPVVPPLDEKGMARRRFLSAPARMLQGSLGQDAAAAPVPTERVVVERPLHTAVRYGVSQALLKAVALTRGVTMAEVVAEEWGLPRPDAPVPIHAQSGSERYHNADKMIVRRLASLPHALVDDVPTQVGENGIALKVYVTWLAKRIRELGGDDYRPTIHLDVHGAFSQLFGNDTGKMLGLLFGLQMAARPYRLRVESPVVMDSRAAQIETMKKLRDYVRQRSMSVELVADEWANTLEDVRAFIEAGAADMIQIKMPDLGGLHNTIDAVLACKAGGVGAFLGGSCAETDLSARVAAHVALATRPDMLLARPGMGVDEGISIVHNEMARTLAWIAHRAQLAIRNS